jgi:hypothetical protein
MLRAKCTVLYKGKTDNSVVAVITAPKGASFRSVLSLMLSWFSRLAPKPSKTPLHHQDRSELPEQPDHHAVVTPSLLPAEIPSSNEPAHVPNGALPTTTALTSEEPGKRAFTAALHTPHDDVLAELQGHHPSHDPSPPTDATPSTSAIGLHSLNTLPLPAATPDALGSTTSSSLPMLSDPAYDPFTGVMMGTLSQASSSAGQSSEGLWTRLSRIRTLQAEVAGMHVTMEGIGLAESAMPRLRRTVPRAAGERLEDDDDTDGGDGAEAEMGRAYEFEQSERRFDGRKERVELIMSKVRWWCLNLFTLRSVSCV